MFNIETLLREELSSKKSVQSCWLLELLLTRIKSVFKFYEPGVSKGGGEGEGGREGTFSVSSSFKFNQLFDLKQHEVKYSTRKPLKIFNS